MASLMENLMDLLERENSEYEKLLELLDTDVTGNFISKFKTCFKQFVMPERTWLYVTEEE